jgi:hypothetical protein
MRKMLKILDGYTWLEWELGKNTEEIEECLDKGLIKYLYGNEDLNPYFLVLESNIEPVKEILKSDYNKLGEMTLFEWIESHNFCDSRDLIIENIYDNYIRIDSDNILNMIEDEPEVYLSNEIQMRIYNSENGHEEIEEYLGELGREQARLQIQALLNNISNQIFE